MAAKRKKTRKSLKLKPVARKNVQKKPVEPKDPAMEKIERMKAERKPKLREMKMLEEGVVPDRNKIGKEFKGKNRVIIA